MQPLKMLNNVQKARLLHSLLLQEIPGFLGYFSELTEAVLDDRERLAREWDNQLFGLDFWLELAGHVQAVMAKYPKELCKSSSVFADQLFDGFTAIFTIHALTRYVAGDRQTDPKFKPAVELLFG